MAGHCVLTSEVVVLKKKDVIYVLQKVKTDGKQDL
jgi:hypothetical protein